MAGISISEYIRRRRLSQAVFDIQKGSEKITDIALKYCYDSSTTFARAFKELHGTTPTSVRKTNVPLKTYPPISFTLIIKGVGEMNFRIEKRDSFQLMGYSGYENPDELVEWTPGNYITKFWKEFTDKYARIYGRYDSAPFWQVGAYDFHSVDGKTKAIIGCEYKGVIPDGIDEVTVKTIPAATWAVFSIQSSTGNENANTGLTRILTEWFPSSAYKRNEDVPFLDVYPVGDVGSDEYTWEIWMPVLNK